MATYLQIGVPRSMEVEVSYLDQKLARASPEALIWYLKTACLLSYGSLIVVDIRLCLS